MRDEVPLKVIEGGAARSETTTPLGRILLERGEVTEARLALALAEQPATRRRLGEILSRRGWTRRDALAAALAAQHGLPRADLEAAPLDPALGRAEDAALYLVHGAAPWRSESGATVWAVADAAVGRAFLARCGAAGAPLALAEPEALTAAILAAYGPTLAERAAARVPADLSVRAPAPLGRRLAWLGAAAGAGAASAFAPEAAAPALLGALVLLNSGAATLRIAALGAAFRSPSPQSPLAPEATSLVERLPPPKITLLIPLLREPETLPVLFAALEALDWPAELLDVILILEADDDETAAEIARRPPPAFCRTLIAPAGAPRTKPRAMNLALDAAEGEIVGVYDAEDRPEPDQLRKAVAAFRAASPEVACVQARLAYFNARENWLTRCFALEYGAWFDVLLPGLRDLRLPIPLGGTSLFFRRGALEALGGWDAHNVTEDADLGVRLARAGFRCEVIDSTTFEEASSRPLPWIRQRSRWLKGYALTWATHMRRPFRLLRELGPAGFLGFQALFLGGLAAYLGLPLFWAAWLGLATGSGPDWLAALPSWVYGAMGVVHLAGGISGLVASVMAVRRRGQGGLAFWAPAQLLYWPLGAAAAYLALVELVVAPTLWRKTRHGVGRFAAAARRDALASKVRPETPQVERDRAV